MDIGLMGLIINFIFLPALSISGGYYIFLLISAHQTFSRFSPTGSSRQFDGISILKPLKGLDDQLEANLRSFFELDYPNFELLFGVADTDDPAIEIVRKLQNEYPNISSELIINDHKIGLNPKVNNLYNILPTAKFQFLLISDSNVRVENKYLKSLMETYHLPETGLVTSPIRGVEARKLGSIYENLHLNSFITPSVVAIKKLIGLPISIGKSMLFRKETLIKIGGFYAFRDILAEDHLMGTAIRDLGMKVRNCPAPINNINEYWQVKNFFNRHLRWAKLRKNLSEFYYLVEFLSNPIPIAVLYALIRFNSLSLYILILTILLKISIDYTITRILKADLKWYHYSLIPFKDLIIGFIWLIPHFSKTVVWRGNVFKISKNTQLVPISKG